MELTTGSKKRNNKINFFIVLKYKAGVYAPAL
jgi:hypothetical protein